MNKTLSSLFFFLSFFSLTFCRYGNEGNSYGKTHFTDILPFQAGFPERVGLLSLLSEKKNHGTLSLIPYWGVSQDNQYIAQFYLPKGNEYLFVAGGPDYFSDTTTFNKPRDIDARIFQIKDDLYKSMVNLSFDSSLLSLGIYGTSFLKKNADDIPTWLIECFIPFTKITHQIKGREQIISAAKNDKNEDVSIFLEEVSQRDIGNSRWNFTVTPSPKFLKPGDEFSSSYTLERSGFPYGEIDIVYNYINSNSCAMATYGGLSIPFLSPTYSPFLFFPDFGTMEHWGAQIGSSLQMILTDNNDYECKFTFDANSLYWFPKTVVRTFDILNGPWSRYLCGYTEFGSSTQTMEPLTNLITLSCSVAPNFSLASTTEFSYQRNPLFMAIGYSFYARQSEGVTIQQIPPMTVLASSDYEKDISSITAVRTIALRLEKENISINKSNQNLYYALTIKPGDIDKDSAIHPALFMGSVYGKLGIQFSEASFIVGASYRTSRNNNVISYASLWLTISADF